MNSRQRGMAPFRGVKADRFPMWYGGAPETTENIRKSLGAKNDEEALYEIIGIDYKTVRPVYKGKAFKIHDDGNIENEWGIIRGGYHWGQALNAPLENVESISEIEKYNFPNPDDWDVKIDDITYESIKDYAVIGGTWAPFFHDSAELMGMEKFFMEMHLNPAVADAIIEKCFEFYYELNRRAFESNPGIIDFYFFGNDFGAQKGLLISPEMWRKFYKNRIKKFIDMAHKNGVVAGLHSCGDIHEIFPDLIDIGLDVINPIQVNAKNMNPEILKREYGKDIVFFGGIDENEILLNGTVEDVRNETRRIIDVLGYDNKYIIAASHDYLLPEIPAENIIAMYDEAKKSFKG